MAKALLIQPMRGETMYVKRNSFALMLFIAIWSCQSLAIEQCLDVVTMKKDLGVRIEDNVDDVYVPSKKELRITGEALLLSLDNYYGPEKKKTETIEFNWAQQKKTFMSRLLSSNTNAEALLVTSDFLYKLDDAHVNIDIPSSYEASLALQFSYVPNNKTIILNQMNPASLSLQLRSGKLPELGTKLLKINGLDVLEFQKRYPFFNSKNGNPLTNTAMFARSLSRIREASGFPLSLFPKMIWKFEFESPKTKEIFEAEFEYKKSGTPLITGSTVLSTKVANLGTEMENLIENTESLSIGKKYRIGQSQPFFELPKSFRKIMLPDHLKEIDKDNFGEKRLHAGVFQHEGKNVGYLRIASYSTGSLGLQDVGLILDHYINQLEASSDYLIIDQMSNPGGSVTYADMIIERLVGEIKLDTHMKFQVKPTHSWMQNYTSLIEAVAGDFQLVSFDPVRHKKLLDFLKEQFDIIHKAYTSGEPYSEPVSLLGYHEYIKFYTDMERAKNQGTQLSLFDSSTDSRMNKKALYSKKIYMLIDHYSFSGGDATPANLKDYRRATLIGTRTAGAGGSVENFSSRLLKAEFNYSLTVSLMYRPKGDETFVENYGVTPHYELVPTTNDYLNGFKEYFQKVLKFISEDLKKN